MSSSTGISPIGLVIKLSCSNIEISITFYTALLGFILDDRYMINTNNVYGDDSYVQLYIPGSNIIIGLFKDIGNPFNPVDVNNPPAGTAPTFMVADIAATRAYLLANDIAVSDVVKSTSDSGYTDCIIFFTDPDNNMLVARQNMQQDYAQ